MNKLITNKLTLFKLKSAIRLIICLVVCIACIIFIKLISAKCQEGQININTASAEELDLIKWIGEATAQEIITYRQDTMFKSVDDLINIYGIGESKLNDIKEQGLACVDVNTADRINTEKIDSSLNKTNYEINYSIVKNQKNENELEKTEKIILKPNPKNIKSNSIIKRLTSNTLYSLGLFSIIIMFLLVLRFNKLRKYKNEFR